MHKPTLLAATMSAAAAHAASLTDICTTSYIESKLPTSDFNEGIEIDSSSVTAAVVYNASSSGSYFFPATNFDFCNVTFAYTHEGLNDTVQLNYWLPAPSSFANRFLATGGGGYAINSGLTVSGSLPGGLVYGAAAGLTDGGFGGFDNQFQAVDLLANGTLNWQEMTMFGYQAIYEMTIVGKALTSNVYNVSDSEKLYSYYQGCSEGGREGWSQVQRFGDELDGAIIGAPAFRYAHQQIQHMYSNVVELTEEYYPPPCEFTKIMNETIAACDGLDGLVDGVIARTDLCILHFDISTLVGVPYDCPATAATRLPAEPAYPAQTGNVTAQGVRVAQTILEGLHDSKGHQAYFSYQPGATFTDGATQYDNETDSWVLDIDSLGAIFPERYLFLTEEMTMDSLTNVTYDTLIEWMNWAWQKYDSTLQTTWPDLTPFNVAGGKVLHFHGEADSSVPTASSVRYWESVRQIMYPKMDYLESAEALNEWYRLYIIPGAVHCAPNSDEPNSPFPTTNMAVMIDWVEKGVVPERLNATMPYNDDKEVEICTWPLRPLWHGNDSVMDCVYDPESLATWHYDLDAFKLPLLATAWDYNSDTCYMIEGEFTTPAVAIPYLSSVFYVYLDFYFYVYASFYLYCIFQCR
ncbi:hypothetical protein ASPZODRAFT_27150 [Penicilliopsis zonata CBS 506.65]|uniref:Carboxylic ester hydrolase n=1 Tax=Penicilliopsis zonata CBS 506.65 TaxID=1073090 RepID=A0A1L9SD98_9EURO|nr:hypothetical protein ASPZODRAFT_27150 [Penicilliopsis zonata CBS 506.65]OJJ45149.1 hypothetical protein ASPZODRAFT_27150 [Penicilliopsis zonata CBS 506.65]